MNTLGRIVSYTLVSMAVREGFQQVRELDERHKIFQQSRECADTLGKPLLVVGAPKHQFTHPCGDVTMDISPYRASECGGVVADVRDIPYTDRYFGAAFCSHVLEHLPTVDDAYTALDELHRVADYVFVVSPHKASVIARLIPSHHLWITASGDGFIIEQRGHPKVASKSVSCLASMSVLGEPSTSL